MHEPRSVIVSQSPCRQTPGNVEKYASRRREPSASPQKPTGMDGIGAVITISPSRPTTGRPASSNASTLAPSIRQLISPAHTGTSGDGPRNPVQRSVPPLSDPTGMDGETASRTQRKPDAGRGAPVEPTPRRAERAMSRPGASPALRQAIRYGAPRPRYVVRVSAATRHSSPASGHAGLPSNVTTDDPTASPEAR